MITKDDFIIGKRQYYDRYTDMGMKAPPITLEMMASQVCPHECSRRVPQCLRNWLGCGSSDLHGVCWRS